MHLVTRVRAALRRWLRATWFLNRPDRGAWWPPESVRPRRSHPGVEFFEERCHPNDLLGMSAVPIMGRWFASAAALDCEIAAAGLAADPVAPGSTDLGSTAADLPAQPADGWFPQTAEPTRDIQTETPSPVPALTTEQPSEHARFVPFAWGQSLVAANGILTDVLGSDPLDNGLDKSSAPPASADPGPTQGSAAASTTDPAAASEAGGGGGPTAPTLQPPPAPVPTTSPANATAPTLNLSAAALPPSSGGRSPTPNFGVMPPPGLTVQFFNSAYCVMEGQGAVSVTAILSGTPTTTVTVNYATSNGSGLAGVDYGATAGTLTFMPGQSSAIFMVPILDDNQVGEASPETVNLTLSKPIGAALGNPSTATLDIFEDNDVVPTVEFSSSSYNATEGQGPVGITAYLTGTPTQTVTVNYATSNGTGLAEIDYGATSGTLTFGPGQTSATFTVPILDDNQVGEASPETVNLTLSNPVGATLGTPSKATLDIVEDNDVLPTVQFSAATVNAGELQGTANVTVTLSPAGNQSVTVNYATSDGTGLAGTDYGATSGVLTFSPGQTIANFQVSILDDKLPNETSPETVNLTLSNPSGATLGSPSSAVLDINEDDSQITWTGPTFSWTQTSATPPTVTPPGDQTNAEGDTVSLAIQASGPAGTTLSYDAVNLPDGLSMNASTGVISGTLTYQAAEDADGIGPVTVVVATYQGGSATVSFTWTVNDTPRPPILTNPGDQTTPAGGTVSLQVVGSQPDGDTLDYSATGLPPGLSLDSFSGLISGTIPVNTVLSTPASVTLTVSDDTLNTALTASQTFTWAVPPTNLAPALTNPGDQSNAAGDGVSLAVSATDADGDPLTYTASGLPAGLNIDPGSGTIDGTIATSAVSSTPYSVTVMVSDGQSSSSQTFHWTVGAISLLNPGDQSNTDGDSVSLPLSASDAGGLTLTYGATGLPTGLGIDTSSGVISGTIANTANTGSPFSVTITASDGTSSASQSFPWTVAPLALVNAGDQQNVEGGTVSLQLSTADVNGTPIYSASGLPPGLSISSTGLISGTIGTAASGSSPYLVTTTATDGGNSSSQLFVWTVTPRVILSNPGAQSSAEGDSVSLTVQGQDAGTATLTYSATGLPPGLSISTTSGVITGTVMAGAGTASPYNVRVTAGDGTSSSSQSFSWAVGIISLASPVNQTSVDGDSASLALSASYHGAGSLSYGASNLPPGLTINPSTGVIGGTVGASADANSPYAVTVTATAGASSASQTLTWTVGALVAVSPVSSQTNAAGDSVSLAVAARDANGNSVTYSAGGLPAGLSINSSTGVISGTVAPGAETGSPYSVTVTVADGASSASQSFSWSVAHVALTNPGGQSRAAGASVTLALQGHDADGDPVTFSATGLPPGLTLNSGTGVISGTLPSTPGNYQVTATASDGTASTSQTFVWKVAGVAMTAPANQTNTEGDPVTLQVSATTASGTLTYSASGLPDGLSINAATGLIAGSIAAGAADNGPFTVTVAADNGSVSASQTFTWTVNPRVDLTTPSDQTNSEGDPVSLQISASEAGATLQYSADGLPSGLNMDVNTGLISGTIAAGDAVNGSYDVTVTVTDGTYSNSTIFPWYVNPATPPAPPTLANPGAVTATVGDDVALTLQSSGPSGYALTFSASGLPDGLDIDPVTGTIFGTVEESAANSTPYGVTVTVSDSAGGSASQTFPITVNASPIQSAQAIPVSAVEGIDTGTLNLATFSTPDTNALEGDFTATVNWGDGSSDTGSISGGSGTFTVQDDHTYAEKGSDPISITLTDANGNTTTLGTAATVADAPITFDATGFDSGVLINQSATVDLAGFIDGNPSTSSSDFTVTINWGDGSGLDTGQVTGLGDEFVITGTHAYSSDGTKNVTVTLTDVDGASATTSATVTVGDLFAGEQANLTAASFTDSNSSTTASDYTAVINWGDGNQSPGQIIGGSGSYAVQGSHTYAVDSLDQPGGVYPVTITATNDDDNAGTTQKNVEVVRPPVSLTVADLTTPLSFTNEEVAVFTEPDVSDGPGEYSATIDWGDGSSSAGTISGGNGLFHVFGSHTYANPGTYTDAVTISQQWGFIFPVIRGLADIIADANGGLGNIQKMKFTGGEVLEKDDGTGAYGAWQWEPGTSMPYAYVRNNQLQVTAIFKVTDPKYVGKKVFFKGVVDQVGFKTVLTGNGIVAKNKTVTISFTSKEKFPDKVGKFPSLGIDWFGSRSGLIWKNAGATANKIYVAFKTAAAGVAGDLRETYVYLGSYGAAGDNQAVQTLTDLWDNNFSTNTVKRADGTPLTYYKKWIKKAGGMIVTASAGNVEGMLKSADGDGQCGAFAHLLENAILGQGLPIGTGAGDIGDMKIWNIQADHPGLNEGFMVKNWKFLAKNNKDKNYRWVNQFNGPAIFGGAWPAMTIPTGYDWKGAVAVKYKGIACQNNTFPMGNFTNHIIVKVDDLFYDPSYGLTYANKYAIQNKAIAGFYDIGGLAKQKMFMRKAPKASKKGGLEIKLL
jgi:hypothetical protein